MLPTPDATTGRDRLNNLPRFPDVRPKPLGQLCLNPMDVEGSTVRSIAGVPNGPRDVKAALIIKAKALIHFFVSVPVSTGVPISGPTRLNQY